MVAASNAFADAAADTSAQLVSITFTQQAATPASGNKAALIARPITATIVSGSDRSANMIICREHQAATGSRLGASRECHTKQEWDDRRVNNQRTIENGQQIGLTGNPPGN
jgi:hypothetical protein